MSLKTEGQGESLVTCSDVDGGPGLAVWHLWVVAGHDLPSVGWHQSLVAVLVGPH